MATNNPKLTYKLRFYKEIESQGHIWRLEIRELSEVQKTAKEIGSVLQGLRLYVQGDQADIDTPIVKTSLEMTFVDAPDLEEDRKCGNWEIFYTSSATEYKVKLYKDGVVEWTGYITPDSYSEDLMYRGSVTIIARDNLGSLQDFEFDAAGDEDGMITLYDLVQTGLERVSFAMEVYDDHSAANVFPLCVDADSPILYKVKFNVSSFREKSWQEAIEDAMYSCGVVLRYVGGNKFIFCSLRSIPLMGEDMWRLVATKDVRFASYGHRELSPAVKTIVDEVQFELTDNLVEINMGEDAYGEMTTGNDDYYENLPLYEAHGQWFTPAGYKTLFLNPFAYGLKEGFSSPQIGDLRATDVIYFANGIIGNCAIQFQQKVPKGKYKLSFDVGTPVQLFDNMTKIGFVKGSSIIDISCSLYFTSSAGKKTYYNSDRDIWQDTQVYNRWHPDGFDKTAYVGMDFPVTLTSKELEVSADGIFTLEIYGGDISYGIMGEGVGLYPRVFNLKLYDTTIKNTAIEEKQKITTRYNENNNIRLTRTDSYGFNRAQLSSPKYIVNGMYVKSGDKYKTSDQWRFYEGQTTNPLPVLIHQQLLAYYSKPNNLLTGELVVDDADFRSLYLWKGKKHLLTAGALNILTGHIEGATLREFKRYSELWETDAETDYVEFDAGGGTQTIALTSNKELTSADVYVNDTWLSAIIYSAAGGVNNYTLNINASENTGLETRHAIIRIDTLTISIWQFAQGDYGTDYGKDYS